jgi:hypothetical protein
VASDRVYIPEVIEPDEKLPADLVALRKFSVLLDEAVRIPGTRRRVGLDAALGLLPGVGDVVSAAMSAWIIAGALRHRVPMTKVLRMVWNVVLDLLIGAVPILGDFFDMLFEQNVANMQLLMQHRNRRLPPRRTSEIAAASIAILIVLMLVAVGIIAAGVSAALWIASLRNT